MSAEFLKVISKKLMNKNVEIYQGTEHDKLQWSDNEITRKTVLRGKIVGVEGDCLIIEVSKRNKKNLAYVNSWTISTIMESKNVFISDIYYPDETRIVVVK